MLMFYLASRRRFHVVFPRYNQTKYKNKHGKTFGTLEKYRKNLHMKYVKTKSQLKDFVLLNLNILVNRILCLPYSSAVRGRVFSQLKLRKITTRNIQHIDTCNSILHVKELLLLQCFIFSLIITALPPFATLLGRIV